MGVLAVGSLVLAVIAGLAWRAWNARDDPGPEPLSSLPLYATAAAACGLTDIETGGRRLRRPLVVATDLKVDGGRLSGALLVTMPWLLHEWALARVLGVLLEAAGRLERPVGVTRRLGENARLDPVAEVRLQNLLMLVREYPERPATGEALVAACGDASDWIRVRAATALGER